MNPEKLKSLLEGVAAGELSVEEAAAEFKSMPFADLGFARVDLHREHRSGFPEIVYGEGKSTQQIIDIARAMSASGQDVMITRLDQAKAADLQAALDGVTYNPVARCARLRAGGGDQAGYELPPLLPGRRVAPGEGPSARARQAAVADSVAATPFVAVIAAGTSDLPVLEEVTETLTFLRVHYRRFCDVGVAGIHRLFADQEAIRRASLSIVVAGMEGALPSVVGGIVDRPLIAVPTSVGYGASFGGLSALLAMMNSCAAGVTVVNIDNGFGAAVAAHKILRLLAGAVGESP